MWARRALHRLAPRALSAVARTCRIMFHQRGVATAAAGAATAGVTAPLPRVLVLGGYGEFGRRICERLHRGGGVQVLVAGRDRASAQRLVATLNDTTSSSSSSSAPVASAAAAAPSAAAEALRVDVDTLTPQQLRALGCHVVVHTCGPFVPGRYDVANACVTAGVHYIDLADSRAFVTAFGGAGASTTSSGAATTLSLHERARAAGVVCLTGASSVPALSAAVVDHFVARNTFGPHSTTTSGAAAAGGTAADVRVASGLRSIRTYISPGNRTPRGLATIRSVFQYLGTPFQGWQDGAPRTVIGWLGLERIELQRLPWLPTRHRTVAHCDVPDLTLFPERYGPGLQTVEFKAGLELGWFQYTLAAMAAVTRAWHLLRLPRALEPNWLALAGWMKRVSEWPAVWALGSDAGGMRVVLDGVRPDPYRRDPRSAAGTGPGAVLTPRDDATSTPVSVVWELSAGSGDGPQIPSTPAVLMAQQLARTPVRPRPPSSSASSSSSSDTTAAAAPAAVAQPPQQLRVAPSLAPGAYPCVGVFTLDDFLASLRAYDVSAAHSVRVGLDTGGGSSAPDLSSPQLAHPQRTH